jgi:glycosyltransferase involved in cell wall biosynthesis
VSTGRGDAILTFSLWDTWRDASIREFCRPPDQVYKSLEASPRVDRLIVADPFRSGPIDLARRARGRRIGFPESARLTHVRPLSWRRTDPVRLTQIRRRYERYDRILHRAANQAGVRAPSLVTFNPFVAAFAPLEWCNSVVYYGRDDWTAFDRSKPWLEALQASYVEMRSRRVTICAVSRVLADRVAGPGSGVVIANGLDAAVWSAAGTAPAAVTALPRPLAGYAGTVDDRLDVNAIQALARSGVVSSIAIFGPVGDPRVAEQLSSEPRVHLLGSLGQRDLVGALMSLDVCLLPHNVTALTKAMSPLKLYEYLASGTPVVATDLPPIRNVDPRVILVADGDFVAGVAAGLARPRLTAGERLEFVTNNAWHVRHEQLIDLLFSPVGWAES